MNFTYIFLIEIFLVEFNPYVYKASRELIEYCKSNGIAIEAYAALGPISYKPGGSVYNENFLQSAHILQRKFSRTLEFRTKCT
jgi:diketogulonate reductase-like aldo/keto reductase